MRVTTPKQSALIDKLIQLAGGDLDLVQKAIRSSVGDTGSADLDKVINYIAERRPAQTRQRGE